MGKKTIKFTNKASGDVFKMLSSALGHHVFDVTKSVNDMNATVRWCNNHGVGDMLENELFKVEIISVV